MTRVRSTFDNRRDAEVYFTLAALKGMVGQKASLLSSPYDNESVVARIEVLDAEMNGELGVLIFDVPDSVLEVAPIDGPVGIGFQAVEASPMPSGKVVGKARLTTVHAAGTPALVTNVEDGVPTTPPPVQSGKGASPKGPAPEAERGPKGPPTEVKVAKTPGPEETTVVQRVTLRESSLLGIEGVAGATTVVLLCLSDGSVRWQRPE